MHEVSEEPRTYLRANFSFFFLHYGYVLFKEKILYKYLHVVWVLELTV